MEIKAKLQKISRTLLLTRLSLRVTPAPMKLPIKIACAFDPVASARTVSLTMHQSRQMLDSKKYERLA